MKNPHQLSDTWNRSISKEPTLTSNKKFKRKSREPKRLFSVPESDNAKTFFADGSDEDSTDEASSRMAALQRRLVVSQEAESAGILSGLTEGSGAAPGGGAIDMRIGINVPSITSKLSQVPSSAFSAAEITHWPSTISQPLTQRLKLGLHSAFPLPACTNSSQQPFNLELPLSGPAVALQLCRTTHTLQTPKTPQGQEHLDMQVPSPKESPRKRAELSPDGPGPGQGPGPGRAPEVKAIQQTRRLLANARERTRVHTISAAFEALRKQVPCYSYGQKLSKLAILRIACNYIVSLAQLAELDYSPDHSSRSFSQCVEQCTRTLQAEGRSKKRKE